MRKLAIIFLIVVAQSSLRAAPAQGSALRIALLPEVVISGDEILLSHLLAEPIPQMLRERASAISLGRTPRFGSVRHLRAPLVGAALADAGLLASNFLIPSVITIHRAGRTVSFAEVQSALREFLKEDETPTTAESGLKLGFIDTFSVPGGDLGLYVRSRRYDPVLSRTEFSLASRAFPDLAPFTVTSNTSDAKPRARSDQKARTRLEPYLVQAGAPAQLIVSAADTQMILSVVPLRSGRQGDVLRVRMAKTAKVLNARVVSKNCLAATY